MKYALKQVIKKWRCCLDKQWHYNMIVIAEGVENKSQLSSLKEHGCDLVQGFYLNKPQNTANINNLLRNTFKGKS